MDVGSSQGERLAVLAVLALAAALRLVGLTSCPPPILPDEATGVYDAYSIFKTGKDRWGESWPVFLESFGRADYRAALYCYLTLPWVALLGPDHFTLAARLPAALFGVITVAALYALVARIDGRRTALWAALLLAVSPWHVQVSRYGHESSLTPLWPLLWGLALCAAGGTVKRRTEGAELGRGVSQRRPAWLIVSAGLLAVSVYSYASMKLFMPAMLLAGVVIYRRETREALRGPHCSQSSGTRAAMLAALAVFALVLAPMIWSSVTAGDRINARAIDQSLFHQGWPISKTLAHAARQYLAHFGPDWLFIEGSPSVLSSIPRSGQLNWIMLPLLAVGLVTVLARLRTHRAYHLLLAWWLLHPLASALTLEGPNAMCAACGLGSFEWIAAIGAVRLIDRLGPSAARLFNRTPAVYPPRRAKEGAICLLLVAASASWSLYNYFAFFSRHPLVFNLMQTDLQEAVAFLRPRWRGYDRIFISDHISSEHQWQSDHPYIYVLVFLPVEPSEFQAWEKEIAYTSSKAPFHVVKKMGPFSLSTSSAALDEYFRNPGDRRALIVARPRDISGGNLLHVVRDRRGHPRFEILEVQQASAGSARQVEQK